MSSTSYTVSRNPDYVIATYQTSQDLIAISQGNNWIVQVISNKGTATPLVPFNGYVDWYPYKVEWLSNGGSVGYVGNGKWDAQGVYPSPMTTSSTDAWKFIYDKYPASWTLFKSQGKIPQAVIDAIEPTPKLSMPAEPLAPLLGDTKYYGDTTGLTPVSGSLLSQGEALQSSDTIQSATTGAPAYEAPPVESDFQALKDAQASAPAGQTVTNIGVTYTETNPQGQITNETTTTTPTPQPVIQTPTATTTTNTAAINASLPIAIVIAIGVAVLGWFGFKDSRKKIIATIKKGVKA